MSDPGDENDWRPDYPHRGDEGPEARLHREQQETDLRIEKFLGTLGPADAAQRLFSFELIRRFMLKRRSW